MRNIPFTSSKPSYLFKEYKMSPLNVYQILNFKRLGNFKSICGLLCLTSLILIACGGNNNETPATTEESTTSSVQVEQASDSDIVAEVHANKEKWLSNEIKQYEIEIQKICFCEPDAVRLMIFHVENNEIQDVRYADSGEQVDPSHYNELNTIEGMFTLVEQALDKNPADISIAYDTEYGYIKELTVDYHENIADDEFTFIASNMKQKK